MDNLKEFLSEPIVGGITGISGIIFGLFFYFFPRKKLKQLSYFHSLYNLWNTQKVHKDLQLLYKNVATPHIIIHKFSFFNKGDDAIRKDADFPKKSKIEITFPNKVSLLGYGITYEKNPSGKAKTTNWSNNSVSVDFEYLNPGDGFNVEILVNSENPEYSISARLIDGKLTECWDNKPLSIVSSASLAFTATIMTALILSVIFWILFWLWIYITKSTPPNWVMNITVIGIFVSSIILIVNKNAFDFIEKKTLQYLWLDTLRHLRESP